MKKTAYLAILLMLLAFFTACDKDDDDDDNDSGGNGTPTTDDDSAGGDDDNNDDEESTYVEKYRFDLALEVDFNAELRMKQHSDGQMEGAFTPETGFDVVGAGVTLYGTGRLTQLPEAYSRMAVLKLQGPVVAGGKCGDLSVSYSLVLTARQDNGYVVGSLTAYCGVDTYTGHPARVMRLSGLQERLE